MKINELFVTIMEKYNSGDEKLRQQATEEAVAYFRERISTLATEKFNGYSIDDLTQAGAMGIIIGLQKYDVTSCEPETYFQFYIMHEMNEYIANVTKK